VTFLARVPILPTHSAGTGDWLVVVVSIAVLAIAIAAVVVYGNRRAEPTARPEAKPKVEQPPVDHRKAA
jgi:hypothetical protein